MKMFRRLLPGPFKCWKDLGWIGGYLVFVVHEGDEVVPDVEDGFHVITTLLHERIAVLPTKTHQTNAAFHTQSRFFKAPCRFGHARSGANRVVDDDHWLTRIDNAFDQFARAVLLALFTDQE